MLGTVLPFRHFPPIPNPTCCMLIFLSPAGGETRVKRHSLYFLVALFELHLLVRNSLKVQTERCGLLSDNLNQTLNKTKIQRATAAPRAEGVQRLFNVLLVFEIYFPKTSKKNKEQRRSAASPALRPTQVHHGPAYVYITSVLTARQDKSKHATEGNKKN